MAKPRRRPWKFRPIETYFGDFTTGRGVNSAGAPIKPRIGGRRTKPALVDLLDTAAAHGCERIFLTGDLPVSTQGRPHWLLTPTEGWKVDQTHGHFIQDNRPPTGRFIRRTDGLKVEVRTAAEWFGTNDVAPETAREALDLTGSLLRDDAQDPHLGRTPTATGLNFWMTTLPKKGFEPELLDDDLAREIHATTGQHRVEHFVDGPSRCECGDCPALVPAGQIERFTYIDGRFMYSSLCREVGSAPALRLTGEQATEFFSGPAGRYNKGRAKIRFTVPQGWEGMPGLVPVAREDGQWHYPCRPGATHTAWVDAVELDVVRTFWEEESFQILEGVAFTKSRALDNFANRLVVAREKAAEFDADAALIETVGAALRSILLQTIGGFHSLGRNSVFVVDSPRDVPPEYAGSVSDFGGMLTYSKPFDDASTGWAFHPEYSSQVWARERARMLQGPIAPITYPNGWQHNRWGALYLLPESLLGINGDAIYTTTIPRAALPVERGGGDDGKVGRLRVKGVIEGPMKAPKSTEDRNRLRSKAEAIGLSDDAQATD